MAPKIIKFDTEAHAGREAPTRIACADLELSKQDLVTLLHLEGGAFPIVQELAVPDREDLRLLGFFLRGLGEENPGFRHGLGLEPFDQDLIP